MHTVISLGYKELNADPKVLYIGRDMDAAITAVEKAGAGGQIAEGRVLRDVETATILRKNFQFAAR